MRKRAKDFRRPDLLVLAPRCSDDPDFLKRLEAGCVARDKKIDLLVRSGQIRFGGVGQWTGSDCPLVVLTGFHQPYHLLTNVGCIGAGRVLAASRAEADREKIRRRAAQHNVYFGSNDLVKKTAAAVVTTATELEEFDTELQKKVSKVPVDTLLYIAITRATWGIIVVEPDARRFVQHFVVGKTGRRVSRAGKKFVAKSSLHQDQTGDMDIPQPRLLHGSQVLLNDTTNTHATNINLSGKDLSLVPNSVISMRQTECLDLSVNNLQRLPKQLWSLPLRELNLSYNHYLGRGMLRFLKEAGCCTTLKKLWLRDVSTTGEKLNSGENVL